MAFSIHNNKVFMSKNRKSQKPKTLTPVNRREKHAGEPYKKPKTKNDFLLKKSKAKKHFTDLRQKDMANQNKKPAQAKKQYLPQETGFVPKAKLPYIKMADALARILEEEKTLCPSSLHPLAEIFKKAGITNEGEKLVIKTEDLEKLHVADLLHKIETMKPYRKQKNDANKSLGRVNAELEKATKQNKLLKSTLRVFSPLSAKKRIYNNQKQRELKKKILNEQVYVPPLAIEFARKNNVITDECIKLSSVTLFLDKHFAHTRKLRDLVPRKTKDPEVVKCMLERGIETIFTHDAKANNDKDLCFIANQIFEKPGLIQSKYGVTGPKRPIGVIILPNYLNASQTEKLLRNNQFAISSHILSPLEAILDLR